MKKVLSITFGLLALITFSASFYILLCQPKDSAVDNDTLFFIGLAESFCYTALFLYTQRLINGTVKAAKKSKSTGKILAIIIAALLICLSDNLGYGSGYGILPSIEGGVGTICHNPAQEQQYSAEGNGFKVELNFI